MNLLVDEHRFFLPKSVVGKYLVIWWYGHLIRKGWPNHQPWIAVQTREYDFEKNEYGSFHLVYLPVAISGQAPIGTIWKCERQNAIFKTRYLVQRVYQKFSVDFSEGAYELCDEYSDREELVPKIDYPILAGPFEHSPLKSRMLKFKDVNTGRYCFVPCMEFFNKFYGHKEPLRRRFLVSTEDELKDFLFFSSKNPPVLNPGEWFVPVGKDLRRNDIPLAAHMRFRKRARKSAKKIYSQLQVRANDEKIFLDIEPWSEGITKLGGYGVELPSKNAFVILNLKESVLGDFPKVWYERENSAGVEDGHQGVLDGLAYHHVHNHTSLDDKGTQTVDLDLPPGHNMGGIVVQEDTFNYSFSSDLEKLEKGERTSGSGTKYETDEVGIGGVGDKDSFGGSTPEVVSEIDDDIGFVSEGKLFDLWHALLRLRDQHSEIKTVEYYNGLFRKFVSSGELSLIKFPVNKLDLSKVAETEIVEAPKRPKKPTERQLKFWLHDTGHVRGLLFIKLIVAQKTCYLIEVERVVKENGKEKKPFQGLGVVLNEGYDFEAMHRALFISILSVRGGMSHVALYFQNKIQAEKYGVNKTFLYKHHDVCDPDNGVGYGENVVRTIIESKLNIQLS